MNATLMNMCDRKFHTLRFGQMQKWGPAQLPWLPINFDKNAKGMDSPGVDFVSTDRFQKEVPPCEFGIYENIGSDGVLNNEHNEGILRASIVVRPVEKLESQFEVIFVEMFDGMNQGKRLMAQWKSPLMGFQFVGVPDMNQTCGHGAIEIKNLSTWKVSISKVISSSDEMAYVAVQLIEPIVKQSKRKRGHADYMEKPGFKSGLKPYAGKR